MSCCPLHLGVCGISQCQVQQPGRCNEPGCRGPQWWQHPATLAPSSSSSCCCWWWTRSSARMTPGRTSTWSPCLLGRRVSSEVWGPGWLSTGGVPQGPRRGPPPPCWWRRGRYGSRPSEPPCSSPWSQVRHAWQRTRGTWRVTVQESASWWGSPSDWWSWWRSRWAGCGRWWRGEQ